MTNRIVSPRFPAGAEEPVAAAGVAAPVTTVLSQILDDLDAEERQAAADAQAAVERQAREAAERAVRKPTPFSHD
jgi:hypothetical protein